MPETIGHFTVMALPFTLMALAVAVAAGTLATGANWGFILVTVLVLAAGVAIFKDLAR